MRRQRGCDIGLALDRVNRVVFAAEDGAHGAEPWTSDGTAAGTRILGDLCAGACGSSPAAFTPHGGVIDFRATWNGRSRLVRTDGITAVPLAPIPTTNSPWIDLTDLGTRTFFAGFDAAHGAQPWVTDGTPAGSRRTSSRRRSAASLVADAQLPLATHSSDQT